MKFDCTQCARCCRNLLESKAKGLPADAARLAGRGIYLLPRVGGLQAWAWEAERMREAARTLGVVLDFAPAMGIVEERGGARRFVTLVYELRTNECPLVRESNLCGAYDARPTVCRAYPLLLTGDSVTISTKCPGAVDAPPSAIRLAYGGAARAVEYAHHLPALVGRHLAFLEAESALRIVRGAAPDEVARLAEAPVDLLDALAEAGARESFVAAMDAGRVAIEG